MHDLRGFLGAVESILASHALGGAGRYRRWNPDTHGVDREASQNAYGCADAANILYTLNRFPETARECADWISALQEMQDPETGLFRESTHHPIHTTAHCIAALELFDARPRHPLAALAEYRDPEAMEAFLENLDWRNSPWTESHRGAGLFAALVLAGEVARPWQDRYFTWLFDNVDPATGLLRKGNIGPVESRGVRSLFPHLAGTFHYLFNQEYALRPLRFPHALVATCLELFHGGGFPLGRDVGFAEIDWVYCLSRGVRMGGHRVRECEDALAALADRYIPFLQGLDPARDEGLNDLHRLFGALCCLAELQTVLPGYLRTERPLMLVLDRRPFI